MSDIKDKMLTGNPGKTLLLFALPMILGNLFQQFYNIMDSIIVGTYVGEDALASVGASYALTTVFIMIAIGGGTGASVIISQFLGAKQYKKMKTAISTAILTFLGVSLVLTIIGLLFHKQILIALSTPKNILEDAILYLKIYFLGLPFLFMYNILASIFNALGDSKISLYLLIFSSILNIVLDLIFVRSFSFGVAGVAIATVIAQGIAAVLSYFLLYKRLKTYSEQKLSSYDIKILNSMVKIAVPSILQQSIVSIGMLLVQSVVNGFGSSVLAGYTAGTRIESICIVPMIALGNAVSTFTAQNIGAGKTERVKKGYLASYKIIAVIAILICILLQVFHNSIIGAFLEEDSGAEAFFTGTSYVSFISFFFVMIGLKASTDGVLRGAGDVIVFTIANLLNLAIRVFVAFYFASKWGVQAVWFAIPIGWTANYFISFLRYLSGKWSKKTLLET